MSDRQKKLVKDIFIYGAGNIGSKLFALLIFPLYTHFLPREDMGYYDITLTVVFLLLPIYTLQLRDGVFRFIIEATKEEKLSIYKYTFSRIGKNTFVLILLAVLINFLYPIHYLFYIVTLVIINGLLELKTFILRIESKKYFVLINLLSVVFTFLFSYIFLIYLKKGLVGVYWANILARLICLLLVEFKYKFILSSLFNRSVTVSKELGRSLFKYSTALIPLAINAFLIEMIGKLSIQHYLGLGQNGIYAVAAKFVTIFLFLSVIFYQAWQETAIIEYKSPNRDNFFSNIFNGYILISSIIVGGISLGLKIFYPILIAKDFQESLWYVFPLLVGVFFIALVSFFDIGYQCAMKTNRTIKAILYTIIINVILNLLLVRWLGLYGACFSYCLSYLFLFIYRYYDTRRYFSIKWHKSGYFSFLLLVLFGCIFYLIENIYILSSIVLITGCTLLLFLRKEIKLMRLFNV